MADISITDHVNLTAAVTVSDDSPLARANLKMLKFSSLPIISDIDKPIDQFPLDEVELGLGMILPSALIGNDLKFQIGGGASGSFSVLSPKQEWLFDNDQFAPAVKINAGECWAGLCVDVGLHQSLATPEGGFGFSVCATESISLGTFIRFPQAGASMPTFKAGLASLIQSYSVPTTPEMIRATPLGMAHTAETTGSIALGASYSAPLMLNPLASLGLPLNLTLKVKPDIDASVRGSLTLEGSLIIRVYRSSPTKLVFGAYKKRLTALAAAVCASVGIGVDVNDTDILSAILGAVVPAADLSGLHLDDGQYDELRHALKECVDHSISLAINACCVASEADESAVVYELDLSGTDMSATDKAIAAALKGDWSQFETLPTAHRVRNVVREIHDDQHKININLLGFYNATSIAGYLKSTTVLHDEHGQITIVDQAAAKSLSAGTTPYAAKSDKLRSALAQAFVATITYGAAKGKLGMTTFTVRQSLLEYHAKASAADISPEIRLAQSVDLTVNSSWDSILKSKGMFNQNKFYLDTAYDSRSVLHLFYQDVDKRMPYSPLALDRMGRDTKIALLDPLAPNSMQRRMALANDEIWAAMTNDGNVANFKLIPGLAKLNPTALAAISADFIDIRWWSDALQSLSPKLTAVLSAIDRSAATDPLTDATFMAAHKTLEQALGNLTAKTQSAFGDGWPVAVMYRLAKSMPGPAPSVQMDIGWNGQFEHYESGVVPLRQTVGA